MKLIPSKLAQHVWKCMASFQHSTKYVAGLRSQTKIWVWYWKKPYILRFVTDNPLAEDSTPVIPIPDLPMVPDLQIIASALMDRYGRTIQQIILLVLIRPTKQVKVIWIIPLIHWDVESVHLMLK